MIQATHILLTTYQRVFRIVAWLWRQFCPRMLPGPILDSPLTCGYRRRIRSTPRRARGWPVPLVLCWRQWWYYQRHSADAADAVLRRMSLVGPNVVGNLLIPLPPRFWK
jgi:hypothetical protein